MKSSWEAAFALYCSLISSLSIAGVHNLIQRKQCDLNQERAQSGMKNYAELLSCGLIGSLHEFRTLCGGICVFVLGCELNTLTWHVISEQQLPFVLVQVIMEITFIYLEGKRERKKITSKVFRQMPTLKSFVSALMRPLNYGSAWHCFWSVREEFLKCQKRSR